MPTFAIYVSGSTGSGFDRHLAAWGRAPLDALVVGQKGVTHKLRISRFEFLASSIVSLQQENYGDGRKRESKKELLPRL